MLATLMLLAPASTRGTSHKTATLPRPAFQASSDLVLINASILDQTGRPVGNLDHYAGTTGGIQRRGMLRVNASL